MDSASELCFSDIFRKLIGNLSPSPCPLQRGTNLNLTSRGRQIPFALPNYTPQEGVQGDERTTLLHIQPDKKTRCLSTAGLVKVG
jgi:hypothetical protein